MEFENYGPCSCNLFRLIFILLLLNALFSQTLSGHNQFDSFTFLSDDIFIMTSGVNGAPSLLHLFKISSPPTDNPSQDLICLLELPVLRAIEPTFRPIIQCSDNRHLSMSSKNSCQSFHQDPSDGLLHFRFRASPWMCLSFFAHRWTLLFYTTPAGLAQTLKKKKKKLVAWETWGPAGTRWLDDPGGNRYLRNQLSGFRYARFNVATRRVCVLDFSPSVMRANRSTGHEESESGHNSTLIIDPSIIEDRELFDADVVSNLPYHYSESLQLSLDGQSNGVAIDIDKVLLCMVRIIG
jgi:hypothetical protein